MSRRARILLAGFFHETHTFVEEITGAAAFAVCRGGDLLAKAGDGSTIDGFLEVAAHHDWDVVPLVDYTALPSGTVAHEVFETFMQELERGIVAVLEDGPVDGVWLALHGAAVTTQCLDPEGVMLDRLRAIPGLGAVPIFGVFDLHAAFTPLMAAKANGLVAYRENPHADARESAIRSAEQLARALAGRQSPIMVVRNVPIVLPPTGTGTAESPMRELEALARQIETDQPDIWTINVVAGFSFADVPDAGMSFSAITVGSREAAETALDRLARLAWDTRRFGLPREMDLDEALRRAASAPLGPVLIVEPADNIGGGAAGDGTAVLRGMMRNRVGKAVVVIADPETVATLQDAAPGAVRHVRLGGKMSGLDEGPVDVDVTVERLTDGRFEIEDRQSHLAASQGVRFDMGPCAVVSIDGRITVLVTSRKTPPFDLAQLRSQGIVPERQSIIAVKAAVAHRRAYDPIAAESFTVSTPGPCSSDLGRLPYRRIRRPIFPLDEDAAVEAAPTTKTQDIDRMGQI